MSTTHRLTAVLTLCVTLNACSLAPRYETPDVSLSEQWVGVALDAQDQAESYDLGWRRFFIDPRLHALIDTALEHNHDLKKAALNVELAQAQYGITKTSSLPALNASASATRARSNGVEGDTYTADVGVNNFELDFFGRVRNASKVALNNYLATQEARDSAQLSVIRAVAKTYYRQQVAQALSDLAQQTLASRQASYELTQLRFREGLSSATDVSTAQSAIAMAESSYQEQKRTAQQAENALAVLLGQPLAALNLPEAHDLEQSLSPMPAFGNTPSQILLNRPDIRQAEYALKSANAQIGVARAMLFPSISLTGRIGYASTELSELFNGNHRAWSFGPSVVLPIFDGGQRRTGVKVSRINQKIAVENYQSTVQTAFQEINDALVARETLTKQYQANLQGQDAAIETLRLVKLQVQEGAANAFNLLDAERADFTARQGVLATLLQRLYNRVDIYTALGGAKEKEGTSSK